MPTSLTPLESRPEPPPENRRVIVVLQGGGALGAYQAGVIEGLTEAGFAPDWVAGVSIGAINGCLVAGNPPSRRVGALRAFWDRITSPSALWPKVDLPVLEATEQRLGAASAVLFGQPGFFRPRMPLEWLSERPPVSYYDTHELHATLEELADFDRINSGPVRLSVGAVNVATGNMIYFDTARLRRLRPDHIMASGALPPGLSAVRIDSDSYWDGGLVSNTPLQYVMGQKRADSLIFQIDLFPARGRLPENLDEVLEREKDIRYSSRTRSGTEGARRLQNQRRMLARFLDRLPPDLLHDPAVVQMRDFACPRLIDVVHLIYRPPVPQGSDKDYQFDRGTMERRWAQGLADARRTLEAAPWRAPAPPDIGLRTFDVTAPEPYT